MKPASSPAALRVQALLGPRFKVVEFDASTRTSAEAAAAIGCTVDQIAKSLVFRTRTTARPVLVCMSGGGRVDEKKVAAVIGETIERADPDFVRSKSGFAIGGVPPVGHLEPPITLVDESLMRFSVIWAAAGTPNAVFELTPAALLEITGARQVEIGKQA